jgi:hypothetical protein
MNKTKDAGLAALARSAQKVRETKAEQVLTPTEARDRKAIKLKGWQQKTSVQLDAGVCEALDDDAHDINKQLRHTGGRRVSASEVMETAFLEFHKLTFDQQVELVRKRRRQ